MALLPEGPPPQEMLDVMMGKTPQGLGDTVETVLHAAGIDKLAEAYERITGRPCNCGKRRDALNRLFPYKT